MSTIATRIARPAHGIAHRQRRACLRASAAERAHSSRAASASPRVHLAEQAYTAELAHAERVRAGGESAHERYEAASLDATEPSSGYEVASLSVAEPASGDEEAGVIAPEPSPGRERRRWIALAVLCLGQLMMVLDVTIVNVALPSIQRELHFSQGNLTWVMNGYLITFGGFLLLAGRMGDLIGRKKVFLAGLVLFTAASVLAL